MALWAGDGKDLQCSNWQMLFPQWCQGSEHLSCFSFFGCLHLCQGWPRAPSFMTSFSPTGRPRLAPPRNVTLLSQNFTVYLTWLPGLGSPPNVTYFVTYKRYRRSLCAGGWGDGTVDEEWRGFPGVAAFRGVSIQKVSGSPEGLVASP